MADKLLRIIISGDAKGALGAFAETEAGADSLGGKMSGLGKIAAAGGAVVAASLVGAGVALFKIGESFDEAYDKIRVGTGQTGEELGYLKDSFRNVVSSVPADFGAASDAITALVSKMGLDGGPILDDLSKQFLELSRITGTDLTTNIEAGSSALMSWNIPVEDYGEKMDEVFRTSQLTGVSFDTLTSGLTGTGLQLRALGFDFEQSTALIGVLTKSGFEAADVMPALGKAMAVAAKDGKDAGSLFRETFDAIKNAPDATAAAGTALEVFGAKAGPKFAELIREGKLDYEGLMGAVANGKDTILGAGQETMDFSEKWDLFKNRVMVALEPLATKVFDGVGKAMDKIGPYAAKFGQWFSDNLPKAMAALQPWVERFASIIQDIAGFITTKVIPAVQGLTNFLRDHDEILKGVAIAIGIMLIPAFVGWAVAAGTAAIATIVAAAPVIALGIALAALVAGIIWVVENWEIFSNAGKAAADWVSNAFSTAVDWITDKFDSLVDFITGLPGRIADAAHGMWDGILAAFKSVINAVIGAWNNLGIPSFHIHISMPSAIPNIDFDTPSLSFPDIPYLAKGGLFDSPTVAMVAEAGQKEIVSPESLMRTIVRDESGGSITIVNRGVIGSQGEMTRWLLAALEDAGRGGKKLGPGGRRLVGSP